MDASSGVHASSMQQNARAATHTSFEFDILDGSECLRFLRSEHVGRLGLTSGALPVVVPIRYRLVGHSVVFATEAGAKLNSARRNAVACMEIDLAATRRRKRVGRSSRPVACVRSPTPRPLHSMVVSHFERGGCRRQSISSRSISNC